MAKYDSYMTVLPMVHCGCFEAITMSAHDVIRNPPTGNLFLHSFSHFSVICYKKLVNFDEKDHYSMSLTSPSLESVHSTKPRPCTSPCAGCSFLKNPLCHETALNGMRSCVYPCYRSNVKISYNMSKR